jgi:hypothetical protein
MSFSILTSKELAIMMARCTPAAIWKRDIGRAKAAHGTLMKDQHYHLTLKNELAKPISADQPWRQLVLEANDNDRAHTHQS